MLLATLFLFSSPVLLPSEQPLCFGRGSLVCWGYNPKVLSYCTPFPEAAGGWVSCSRFPQPRDQPARQGLGEWEEKDGNQAAH